MITLKQWMETFNYLITEGDRYSWTCYGDNAQLISAWNGKHSDGGWSGNIVFDTVNQTVYEVEICDYTHNRAYRIINPQYRKAYDAEAKKFGADANEAWDGVKFVDLEMDEDWLLKAQAIVAGDEYDTRVSIPLELPEHELLVLFKMAHERDMKFNDFVEDALRQALEQYQHNPGFAKKEVEEFRSSIPHGY